MRWVRCLLCLVILFAGGRAAISREEEPPLSSPDELSQLRAATVTVINYWERMVAKELRLRDQSASSDQNVYLACDRLALARHELALLQEERAAACERLRAVIRIRDEELRRIQRQSSQAAASAFSFSPRPSQRSTLSAAFSVARTNSNSTVRSGSVAVRDSRMVSLLGSTPTSAHRSRRIMYFSRSTQRWE
jgi:hypothetical protein